MGKLIDIPSIIIAVFLALPAHAELRTLPGSTWEIAVKSIGCSVVVDGHVLMNGKCHLRRPNNNLDDVFMTLPDAATQVSVTMGRRRFQALPSGTVIWSARGDLRGAALWVQTHGKAGLGLLREEKENCPWKNEHGFCPCWSNERVRLCTWPLEVDPPPGVPPELPSAGEVISRRHRREPPAPLSPSEQQRNEQMNELSDKMNRMLEEHTKQPPVR